MTENMIKNIPYMMNYEENRLTDCNDNNASLVWNEETNEYIIVFWTETWAGYHVEKIQYTGTDDIDYLTEKLYRKGYIE